jgi:hypothetical protein
MASWPTITSDVIRWFRDVFYEANRAVCERMANLPNIRETSLDDGLIEALVPESAPRQLDSGAIVRMDIHNIGGLRRYRRWETADIALLIFIYRGNDLVAKKVGFLQSKRLYPKSGHVDAEDEVGFLYGMNAYLRRDGRQAIAALERKFSFDADSVYGAILAGDEQLAQIDELNSNFGKAVYYLLYNPHVLPYSVAYPLGGRVGVGRVDVGCRVVDVDDVRMALSALADGQALPFERIQHASSARNWPLETWAADLLLTCKVGQQFDDSRDEQIASLLERRSGPIGAAIATSITLPG